MNKITLPLIGYASGIAAGDPGCGKGPLVLQQANFCDELTQADLQAYWEALLFPPTMQSKLQAVADICTRTALLTQHLTQQNKLFAVLGGDHSCAIGTWSGVSTVKQGNIGLIWIDAHMDSHTPETTESGNIHGMPLASLLGYGATELTHILSSHSKLQPEHLSLIGVRSFEAGEAELLYRLGVKIYFMEEVQQRGIDVVLAEAIQRANAGTVGYGLSIDLDAIDPSDAPGTGAKEPHGIRSKLLCKALQQIQVNKNFLGIEIVEFDPVHDQKLKTQKLIKDILLNIFSMAC